MKRVIYLLVTMLMMSSFGFADESILNSGTIDGNGMINWIVYDNGRLTLDGSGSIADYSSSSAVPWYSNRDAITSIELSGDISSIGKYAFYACTNVTQITSSVSVPPTLATNTFNSSRLSSIMLYVPSMYISDYQMSDYWKQMQVMSSDGGVMGDSNAYLAVIYVDGSTLDGFDPYTFNYHVELPTGTTVAPVVTYLLQDESCMVDAQQADSPNGMAKITVMSSDGSLTNTYEITFTVQEEPSGNTPTGGDAMSGTLENGQSWSLENGTLSLTGGGNIAGFASPEDVPWYNYRGEITYLFLGADYFSIGGFVFYDLYNLTTISCPSSYFPTLEENTFSPALLSQITATVRANLLSQFQADPYWSQMQLETYPDSGDDPSEISGMVGELTWSLNANELIIDGIGVIPDFDDDEGLPWVAYKDQIYTIKLNGEISSIGMYAFAGLTNLNVLNGSSSLQYIGAYAFRNCQALTDINLPVNEVVAVDADAFSGCLLSNITVYVPEEMLYDFTMSEVWGSMNVVGNGSSGDLGKLLESGECGPSASWEIYENGLLNITGSGNLYYWPEYHNIPWDAYRSQINSVQVVEGIESLTTAAFFDCVQLTSITLPASLCCIDDSTFYNCVALRTIACGREYPPSVNGTYPFYNVTLPEITLTVPEVSESVYGAAEYWGQMQIVAQGGSTSQLEPYQLEYIFVNSIGITGFDPGIYTYNVTLPAGSATPHLSYMAGNLSQDVEIVQPTSPNSTGYLHVSVDGVRQATYTINFSCETNQVTIALSDAWKFIMLPSSVFAVNYEDIVTTGDVVWARYDGEKRAAGQSGWTTVELVQSYYKDWGHIVRVQNGTTATLTINMPADASSSSASIQLRTYDAALPQNASWNLIGNPYNAEYDIKGLQAAGITSPIHVWNGTGYTTYDPEYDDYALQPFEAFFVQLSGSEPETIMLSPQYIVGGNGGTNTGSDGVADAYGALPGYFSVGEGIQVQFSRGNLQYNAVKNEWQFAENQYDYIGESNANISESYAGWIDLFGWGTGNNPTLSVQDNTAYVEFVDWGNNPISNGGGIEGIWRTLTNDEWNYLFYSRANASNLYGVATVNGKEGLVILPDNWSDIPDITTFTPSTDDFSLNSYTYEDWSKMEFEGAVFLPAADLRNGTSMVDDMGGIYWSSSYHDVSEAYYLNFSWEGFRLYYGGRSTGSSVRLVK